MALLEFPTMTGRFFRMTFEDNIPDFIDYTINKVSTNEYTTNSSFIYVDRPTIQMQV